MIPSSQLKLGDYILCPLNQQLEYAEQRIPLEPKVYEVLCYLLAHQQRFVSLEELHKEVWQGRVVSDTAVRRTISKLRAALNDQGDSPRYIQSAAKRGYRWLIPSESVTQEVNFVPSVSLQPRSLASQTEFTSMPGAEEASVATVSSAMAAGAKVSRSASLTRFKFASVTLLSVAVLVLVSSLLVAFIGKGPDWKMQTALPLIVGEKLSMAISPDKRFLVFSSNAVNHHGQELYWYNLATQELRQLTTGDNQIMYVAYAADGKHLFYHNFYNGVYQLVQRPISEQGQFTAEGKVLLDDYASMFKIWVHPDNESLLLNLGDAEQLNIQRLHLPTGSLTPLTSSVTAGVYDSTFAPEIDSQRLAFQRSPLGQSSSLIIQDMSNGRILQQFLHKERIFDLHWLTEQELLIVDEEAIKTFNLQTRKSILLQQNYQTGNALTRGLTRMLVPLRDGQWLQFRHEGDVSRMIHQQGEVGVLSGRSYIHTEVQTRAVFFSQVPQEFFLLNLEGDKRSLLSRQANGEQQLLFEIQDSNVSFQQQHPNGESLLLLLNGKPTLFDLKQHQLTPLNVVGNNWLSARFSHDGQQIVMTSRQNSEYQSWLYHVDTGLSQLLYQGYQIVIPYQDKSYLAVHPDSRFVLLEDEHVTELPINYSPPFPGSVHLRGTYLFWAETDLKNTTVFRFNLENAALEQWQQDRRQMLQTFDVSADGSKWLLRHIGHFDTKVYQVLTDIR
ncbi:hypothetical protein GCM10010919_06320 [Alishewanella longhuensis]|uniref:OmpR/PhoB-type domain-containing protein n=1 Tax=Alishewanella longhuensis TaxID=1091037 RepID=A0ABQ3KUF2_9ALTE|nr:winged helix-turn-helix domain-containing protein [Alishewanella longhuensis]GHG61643.1 hypothetical protein GCM10010919_06320 [Alishewanella longhuensis]